MGNRAERTDYTPTHYQQHAVLRNTSTEHCKEICKHSQQFYLPFYIYTMTLVRHFMKIKDVPEIIASHSTEQGHSLFEKACHIFPLSSPLPCNYLVPFSSIYHPLLHCSFQQQKPDYSTSLRKIYSPHLLF